MSKNIMVIMCCKCHVVEADIYNDEGGYCCVCWNELHDSSPKPNKVLSNLNYIPNWSNNVTK
jgi:hypothetical protein